MFAVGIIAALLAIVAGVKKAEKGKSMSATSYQTSDWSVILAPLCSAAGVPLEFALKWIEVESGGNPCAIGSVKSKGPDGYPREIGLVQLWNPDDFDALGIKPAQLRSACGTGATRSELQACARPLSSDEMLLHAQTSVKFIVRAHVRAASALQSVGASWGGRDPWMLTKLVHALPGLVTGGLSAVAKHLGKPPSSWNEFRDTLADVVLPKNTEEYRWDDDPTHKLGAFGKLLHNAQETGAVVKEEVV